MAAVSQTTLSNIYSWMQIIISIKISLKFVPKGPINNIPALVQMMAWRHYLNQWCLVYWHMYASVGLNELNECYISIWNPISFQSLVFYQLHITAACTNTGGKMTGSRPRAADLYPFIPSHS